MLGGICAVKKMVYKRIFWGIGIFMGYWVRPKVVQSPKSTGRIFITVSLLRSWHIDNVPLRAKDLSVFHLHVESFYSSIHLPYLQINSKYAKHIPGRGRVKFMGLCRNVRPLLGETDYTIKVYRPPIHVCTWGWGHPMGKIQTLSVTFALRTSLKNVRGHSNRTSGDIPTGCPAMFYFCIFTWYLCPLCIYMNS